VPFWNKKRTIFYVSKYWRSEVYSIIFETKVYMVKCAVHAAKGIRILSLTDTSLIIYDTLPDGNVMGFEIPGNPELARILKDDPALDAKVLLSSDLTETPQVVMPRQLGVMHASKTRSGVFIGELLKDNFFRFILVGTRLALLTNMLKMPATNRILTYTPIRSLENVRQSVPFISRRIEHFYNHLFIQNSLFVIR
jgi:hypothetical protein